MFVARFKPISNQADWSSAILFAEKATGTPIDISTLSFTLELRGIADGGRGPCLAGSSATGELTSATTGILLIYFPAARLMTMPAGSYDVGLTLTDGVRTAQAMIGRLPIIDGFSATSIAPPQWSGPQGM